MKREYFVGYFILFNNFNSVKFNKDFRFKYLQQKVYAKKLKSGWKNGINFPFILDE